MGTDIVAEAGMIYQQGTRYVRLEGLVDLSTDSLQAVRILTLVRELTSFAIQIDWKLRIGSNQKSVATFSHLQPPAALVDADDGTLEWWRSRHYLGRCYYRRGPGFIQVRDRRKDELHHFTIDNPHYIEVIDMLLPGVPISTVPQHVLSDFAAEGLISAFGEYVWWAPYRVRRWPIPAWEV